MLYLFPKFNKNSPITFRVVDRSPDKQRHKKYHSKCGM